MCVIETSPVIETRRLALRAPGAHDIPRIAQMASDPDIARMTCRMPTPFRTEDAEAFVMNVAMQDPRRANTFVIEHEDHGPVGVLGLFHDSTREPDSRHRWNRAAFPPQPIRLDDQAPEMGYWIGKPFWGRGLATEAAQGALAWARGRWSKKAVVAGHFADNPASGRVLEKAGFLYTGETRRQFSRARQAEVDTRMMVWLA